MNVITNVTKVEIDLTNAVVFPQYNAAVYPERDGVRFALSLRKELEKGGVEVGAIRSHFIATFVRLGKTKAHASNYWDKTNKQRQGIDVHKTNKTWQAKQPKKSTAKAVEGPVELISQPVVELVEQTVIEPVVEVSTETVVHERWRVVNKTTQEIVASFTSRDKAQTENKIRRENGEDVKWVDGLKSTN